MSSTTNSLYERVEQAIQSGQSGIWIRGHEPTEVITTLIQLWKAYQADWDLALWDDIHGLSSPKHPAPPIDPDSPEVHSLWPALVSILAVAENRRKKDLDEEEFTAADNRNQILVVLNGHQEIIKGGLPQAEVITAMQHLMEVGKGYKCHIILLSFPGIDIPVELSAPMWVIDHELPNAEERGEIVDELLETYEDEHEGFERPMDPHYSEIIKTCGGLTRGQVEGVISLSLAAHQEVREEVIWRLKAETLNKDGLLTLHRGMEKFDSYETEIGGKMVFIPGVGGAEGFKEFHKDVLRPGLPPHIRARASILVGIPGAGKSAVLKALGNEMKRPTLWLDVGRLMGGIVGTTEANTRRVLSIADAMEPCDLCIDEIEKGLGGKGGELDGGVNSRFKGTLLTWQNDHTTDVWVGATSNDISMLPPEFLRAERLDSIWFFDLPGRKQKDQIWGIYLAYFGLKEQQRPDDAIWTGAEIRYCCRLAALRRISLVEAAKQVIPVVKTSPKTVERLRLWANKRCLDAETGEIYRFTEVTKREKAVVNATAPTASATAQAGRPVRRRTK